MRTLLATLGILCLVPCAVAARAADPPQATVEVEEDVYRYEPADNGAGPMWCRGSTSLVRVGDDVFASGLETLGDAKPLNNCRWTLHKRGPTGWELQQADPSGRTREPSPVATLPGGRVLVSVNPTLTGPGARAGPARPEILDFAARDPKAPPKCILPKWDGTPKFTEHSYRTFAADSRAGSLILFQNIGYTHAEWAFRDAGAKWTAGRLKWPWGAEYDKPQPIRVCYPTVAVNGRAVYFCGVSDIIEPRAAWRQYKQKLTGRAWDYDFRRLFYTWTDDVTTGRFHEWVEIADRDKTCGWVTPWDLWVAPDGGIHLLWGERAIDTRLRERFYPDAKQSHALVHAIVRDGGVVRRRSLLLAREGGAQEIPGAARFQATPDGRLFVFFYVSGRAADGKQVSENRLLELGPDGTPSPAPRVPLKHPLRSFFTATVRAGNSPSRTLDLLGERAGARHTISYTRIRIR